MPINVKDKKGNIVAGPKKGNTMREAGKMKSRQKKMGGGMMMQRPGMKQGSKAARPIPPQLRKFVMAKKKKAAKKT